MPSGVLTRLNFCLGRSVSHKKFGHFISKPTVAYSSWPPPPPPMAAPGSNALSGNFHVDEAVNGLSTPSGVFLSDRRRVAGSCLRASVRVGGRDFTSSAGGLVSGFFGFDSVGRRYRGPVVVSSRRSFNVLSSAQDVGIPQDQQPAGVTLVSGQTLKLQMGACYLPHPDKESYGGEDAHFICADEQAFGVADGVGGWAEVGINAGDYARELMSNSVRAIREEPQGLIDAARVLEKAHSWTKAQGSSTACIIALTSEGLHAINLGDSGFVVIRDGCTIFQSPVQQHSFNFTYQLANDNAGDPPSSGQVFTIATAPGDVVVAGTDGLFDNLYNNDVTSVVVQATRAGMEPKVTAQQIAALARERAIDRNRQSPFSTAAQEAGYRYYGGKLDDITVVVSSITGSSSSCM